MTWLSMATVVVVLAIGVNGSETDGLDDPVEFRLQDVMMLVRKPMSRWR